MREVHIFDGSNRKDGVAMEMGGGTDWMVGKEIILHVDVASLRLLLFYNGNTFGLKPEYMTMALKMFNLALATLRCRRLI